MTNFSIPYRKILNIFLAIATIVVAIVVTGCGGGHSSTSKVLPSAGWTQVGATYVGRYRCRDCHATIDDEFSQNPKGNDAQQIVTFSTEMATGNCAECHVTGYGETSGGTTVAKGDSDPTNVPLSGLYGVTCESCHGPGSKHVAASTNAQRIANITLIPKATATCYNCHTGSTSGFKMFNSPIAPVDDATLATQNPGLRGPHHLSGAAMIQGVLAYGFAAPQPSPHSTLPNDCIDCHLQPTINPTTGEVDHGANQLVPNTDTTRAQCVSCHGGATKSDLALQSGITDMLITLGGVDPANPGQPDPKAGGGLLNAYVVAHSIVLTTNTIPTDPSVMAYKGARYNYMYVLSDGSLGVHNPGYIRQMLQNAITALSQ